MTCYRNHVIQDVRPYVCIEVHCPERQKLYSDRQSWEAHLSPGCSNTNDSQKWCCICGEEFSPSINTEAESAKSEQGVEVKDLQLALESSQRHEDRNMPEPYDRLKGPSGDIESKESHWARHMEEIALLSLPEEEDYVKSFGLLSISSSIRSSRMDSQSVSGWSSRSSSRGSNRSSSADGDREEAQGNVDDPVVRSLLSDREDDLLFISQGRWTDVDQTWRPIGTNRNLDIDRNSDSPEVTNDDLECIVVMEELPSRGDDDDESYEL